MSETVKVRRALLSVSNKSGLTEFAEALSERGVELVSTGGTAKALSGAGLKVRDVADLTGFPEMMDGRVKTLHPAVHGGLLAVREAPDHMSAAEEHGIGMIDLLVVNLYPFEATALHGADAKTCIENIDIGGPAMIRAAAKNHASVAVVVEPADYDAVIADIDEHGGTCFDFRRTLAAKAFARTASYDAAIANWFANETDDKSPGYRAIGGRLLQDLRYGENPHQWAAFYRTPEPRPGVSDATQHQGKELSFNNINDTNAAFELVAEFDPKDRAAVAIIKHANPCGVAQANTLSDAYRAALACDPTSAFGGIVALNRTLDAETAELIAEIFTEVIIAPDVSRDAKSVLKAKPNIRLLTTVELPDPRAPGLDIRTVAGGMLVQARDAATIDDMELQVVTKRQPTSDEMRDMRFAFRVAKHVKSNAIVFAKDRATVGIGAGQMSRIDSTLTAARKSGEAAQAAGQETPLAFGSVAASDAFFPFPDGLLAAADAGATAIIQPGGSIKDEAVIAAADDRDLAMIFTGTRHFRH
ncbi:MAG: bifunctional phosphoribosylaminoimidazolecarboxamide formyltransferase/IMP cyclohydrolase [Pseudomonadota bacterium]